MKRTLNVLLLALALLVGPVAAVCGSCCPEAAPEAALASPQGCCGDCEPTVEDAPDPLSLAAKSTAAQTDYQAALLRPTAGVFLIETISLPAEHPVQRVLAPPSPPAPLRL